MIAFQEEIVAAVGKEKAEVELLHVDAELQAEIIAAYNSDLQKAVQVEEKLAREAATQAAHFGFSYAYGEQPMQVLDHMPKWFESISRM